MKALAKKHQMLAIGTVLGIFASTSAQATVLATWGTADVMGTAAQNSASYEASGITGSDLSSIYGPSSGYTPGYEWGIWGSTAAANEEFELTLSTSKYTEIDTFSFEMFNNDCQIGYGYVPGCATASWAVSASVNGGAFGPDLDAFNAGPPGTLIVSVDVNQVLNIGDSITMQIRGTSGGSYWPGSGQYVVRDVSLNGLTVPEPAALALLGMGLLGFGASRFWKL